MYRSKGNGWMKHSDFMLTDLLWLMVSLFGAYFVRMGNLDLFQDEFYLTLLFLYPVIHIGAVLFLSGYRDVLNRGYAKELKATISHNVVVFLMIVVYMFLSKRSDIYSRIVVCLTLIFSCVLMYLSRILLKKLILRSRSRTERSAIKVLIMSDSGRIESTVRTALENNMRALNICGLIVRDEDMTGRKICDIPVVASGETWKEYILTNVVDEILLDIDDQSTAGEYIKYINTVGATAHLILDLGELESPSKVVQEMNGFTVVSSSLNIASPKQRFIKRTMDICFGLVGALAVIVLTIFIGPIIYLEDRGPIFFTQKRVGRNGRVFNIIKYRTMYTDAEQRKAELMKQNEMSGNMFKMKDDPRITRVGKFLRKTSIDELPQAFNILAGSMSVVGTRPPTLDEFKQYEPHHKVRLSITPGLTGMWQVSGRSEITDFEEIVKLDEQYISNWNITLDLKIILKTFIVVFKREGAE